MNILVIPEDFRKDQYMLKPLVSAVCSAAGARHVKVQVCMDPLHGGITEVMKWERISEIISQYKWLIDLFIICVDPDGEGGRIQGLSTLEGKAMEVLNREKVLFTENAWQEIEVWVLAGHNLPDGWEWREIREEIHPKELYYLPFAREKGVIEEPGEGRGKLAVEATQHYARIRRRCPEDIANLENRIRNWLES